VERIVSYAAGKIDPAANGVALFACWGAGEFFEAIQLTTPVSDNRVYACPQPHLYHLARLDEQYPRYAAVLTDTNTARIFVFGLDHVIAAEEASRDHIADENFAFPKERKEPIHDAAHVRDAIARFRQVEGVTDSERDAAWKRIKSAAKKHRVELNEQDWRELS
jgi:hypothetical protein